MNVNPMNKIVALLSVSALLITTGCGDEGDHSDAVNQGEYGSAEFAILSIDHAEDRIEIPVENTDRFDAELADRLADVFGLNGEIPEEPEESPRIEVDIDHIPDAMLSSGTLTLKSNGPVCADMDTWKEFSHQTCDAQGGHLKAISPGGECGNGFYAGTTFLCTFLDTNGEEIDAKKFQTFTVGGRGTCKPYASFLEYAAHVCDGEENLREKHILGSCDLGTSEDGYSAVRYTCEV